MITLLMQAPSSWDRLWAIRQELVQNDSWQAGALMGLGILAFFLLLYLASAFERRRARTDIDDSRKLFRSLLAQLELTVRQRDLLRRLVRDLRLQEPAIVLLAPELFWSHVDLWLSQSQRRNTAVGTEFDALAARLFAAPGVSPATRVT
jgi:hypothetical protein